MRAANESRKAAGLDMTYSVFIKNLPRRLLANIFNYCFKLNYIRIKVIKSINHSGSIILFSFFFVPIGYKYHISSTKTLNDKKK